MKVFIIAQWWPIHGEGGERRRMHTYGAFLDKRNARQKAFEMNQSSRKYRANLDERGELRYPHIVISYKLRDANLYHPLQPKEID